MHIDNLAQRLYPALGAALRTVGLMEMSARQHGKSARRCVIIFDYASCSDEPDLEVAIERLCNLALYKVIRHGKRGSAFALFDIRLDRMPKGTL